MSRTNILIYVLRRDLRVSDNPILHHLSTSKDHGFTHFLPLYFFHPQQLEVKGFIPETEKTPCPYPEARSQIAGFWRTGPHRLKFLSESVWDLKKGYEKIGSGLCFRIGMLDEIIKELVGGVKLDANAKVGAVWITAEVGVEELRDERAMRRVCKEAGVEMKLWIDEKYLKDDRDLPFKNPQDAPNIFTDYRTKVEPLRDAPRKVLSTPIRGSLPPFPTENMIPAQHAPFRVPDTLKEIQHALMDPLAKQPLIKNSPARPDDVESAHPFLGGESQAQDRLEYLISSGAATTYKDTRNGLLGLDFSTKLSAYLVMGCITSRQIHAELLSFEEATDGGKWNRVAGYGQGENEGTKSIRFELLWRDYMRLCNMKFRQKLFHLSGFNSEIDKRWVCPDHPGIGSSRAEIQNIVDRCLNGTTGMGLIDASQRELFHTGYTSNRARQNFASFFSKHMWIDWRIGAEWYESMLVDYDVSSNWGNWQYLAGVGNDPRSDRIFNPVKQAFDYDPSAEYVKAWLPELKGLTDPGEVFQPWTIRDMGKKRELGLLGLESVDEPLKRIEFTVGKNGRHLNKQRRGRGSGSRSYRGYVGQARTENIQRGGEDRGTGRSSGQSRGGYGGLGGYGGSSRGNLRGGYSHARGGGRELRTGAMDKDRITFTLDTSI